jgi:hypothetical protein
MQADPSLLNVGWIDQTVPYNQGSIEKDLTDTLLRLCRQPVNLTRGIHPCPFCKLSSWPPIGMTIDDRPVTLGNGEIRVNGDGGVTYAAPTLICHYIREHNYCPPEAFLIAVRKLASIHEESSSQV